MSCERDVHRGEAVNAVRQLRYVGMRQAYARRSQWEHSGLMNAVIGAVNYEYVARYTNHGYGVRHHGNQNRAPLLWHKHAQEICYHTEFNEEQQADDGR